MTAVARVPVLGLTSVRLPGCEGEISATVRARGSRRARKLLGRRVFFAPAPPLALPAESRAAAYESLSQVSLTLPRLRPKAAAPPGASAATAAEPAELLSRAPLPDGARAPPPPPPRALNRAAPAEEERAARPEGASGAHYRGRRARRFREGESTALQGHLAGGRGTMARRTRAAAAAPSCPLAR